VTSSADAARAEYERAIAYDREGFEAQAIPHYEVALRLGLDDALVPSALLGLGSSLRNVDRADDAAAVLTDACERFPDHAALALFRALALASSGRCEQALGETIRLAAARIDAEEIRHYRRALDEYADELAPR
jgi:tetratricopeptide (TPR) repeat protein